MEPKKRTGWAVGLRRALALFLAVMTVWVVSLTADLRGAADALGAWGEQTAFAMSVLEAELGPALAAADGTGELSAWERLVVRQSPLLSSLRWEMAADPLPTETGSEAEPTELLPSSSASADRVVERTLVPQGGEGYDHAAEVYIQNPTGAEVDVAAMAGADLPVTLGTEGPQVLILHTHGSEAYTPDGTDVYEESSSYRTTDNRYNVVRVGEEMAAVLEEYGIGVVHDTELYDYPAYNGAYGRSTQAVAAYLERYPSIRVVLDVHRDALVGEDGTTYKVVADADGTRVAQVMMVVGSDQGGAEHPNWRQNLTFAVKVQQALNSRWADLARPIALRSSRYNQQYLPGCLLVEVGSHGNTLQEAIAGGRLYARALAELLQGGT